LIKLTITIFTIIFQLLQLPFLVPLLWLCKRASTEYTKVSGRVALQYTLSLSTGIHLAYSGN